MIRPILIAFTVVGVTAQSDVQPNLTGVWRRLDGAVAADEMRLDQAGATLRVQKAGFPLFEYRFDGVETSSVHVPPIPPGSLVTRKFKASPDGNRLIVRVTTETKTSRGTSTQRHQETLYLDDKDRLIVEVQELIPLSFGTAPATQAKGEPALAVAPDVRKTTYVRSR